MYNFLERVESVKNGLSTSAFARQLGMGQKTVDFYLRGERKPSVEFVRNICSTFGVSSDWLLGLPERGGGQFITKNTGAVAIGSNARATVNGRANIPRGEAELAKRGASGVTPAAPPPDCKNCKYKRLADAFKAL